MQCTLLFHFAGNLVFLDDFKNQLRRIAEHIKQTVAILLAKHARQIIRHHPHASIDKAHIATGTTIADLNAFQYDGVGAFFSQMQSRRKAGKSATHDHHIGGQVTIQRRGLRCSRSGLFPKAMRARIVQHSRQPFRIMKNRRLVPCWLFHAAEATRTAIFAQQFMLVRNDLY